ncbi:hypothetical protein [Actinoplanes sp. NPDC051851]|uniref:hypothetical protein n=1 Tax=Actinoplanes sp. NPDC051851 TaxID=3154753 RepID=UPI0034257221
MSRRFRWRVAALVASGLIFGGPLLTSGTASADQFEPGERRVNFDGGGVFGLSCDSTPEVESLTVPPRSVVHMVNRTGRPARLELAGTPQGIIPDNGTAEVFFRRGVTSVLLDPDCSDDDDAVPLMVTASPSAAEAPSDSVPSDLLGTPAPAKSLLPDPLAPPVTRSHRPRSKPSHPIKTSSRTPTAPASSPATPPPSSPAARESLAAAVPTTIPPVAAAPLSGPFSVPEEGQPLSEATEPVAAVASIREGRPLGMLGMVAVVCLLGVSTAAIRAIVSQRASRANLA